MLGRIIGRAADAGRRFLLGAWSVAVAGTATATASNGTLALTGDGTNSATAEQSFATVPGRAYRLRFTGGTNGPTFRIGSTSGGTDVLGDTAGAVGFNSVAFVAKGTTTFVRFARLAASLSTVAAISCTRDGG